MDVSFGGIDLADVGFVLQSFERPSGRLRAPGYVVPGLDGYQTALPTMPEHDAYEMVLQGFVDGDTSSLRSAILGSCAWQALIFSDKETLWYQAQGAYVDEEYPGDLDTVVPVSIGFTISPPCLLGAEITATSSPVNNPGDYPCPAVWTIAAAGDFTLTVGAFTCRWVGGPSTVVIDSERFEVTRNGAPGHHYLAGGYPWLVPGPNVVNLTSGSTFSVSFNPRYA